MNTKDNNGNQDYSPMPRGAKRSEDPSGIRLPVLLYHHVGPPQTEIPPGLTILPYQFERQVRWLAARGYIGICAADWLEWHRDRTPLPDRPVLLTFDDAFYDIAEYALPALRQYGFGATVFVVTEWIGKTNPEGARLMSAEQIREWAERGIEFGLHSRTHADLTRLGVGRLEEEVVGSRQDLTSLLGAPVASFAYPYGDYNDSVLRSVQRAFDLAFTVEEGLNDLCTNPYRLRRTMVQPCDSLIDLACRVRLGWSPVNSLRSHLRVRSRARALMQFSRARNS